MNKLNKNTFLQRISWWVFGGLSIIIGIYPIIYFLIDRTFGLLQTKSLKVLNDTLWNIGFYGHIIFAGLALTIGWIQFSKKLRNRNMPLHRKIGMVYMFSVLIGGITGIYIGFYATGGIISSIGFISLGVIWLYTTWMGLIKAKNGQIAAHEYYMTLSYAACFAAVTLRIWLPILILLTEEFNTAYQLVAWLCWVPNIVVAFFIINRKKSKLIANVI